MKNLVLKAIRCYQGLSPFRGRHCRFIPTCSEYCYQAIFDHGILRGSLMGLRRILRCHPLNKGGVDLP
ncbi:MAG: Putative membrane protein insertion efficiency factor [Microgenomates bacterium 39_6]|nr:MAG: Putative membrane protein insertion efficiency factor [Microgenomates bacterium 39_6]